LAAHVRARGGRFDGQAAASHARRDPDDRAVAEGRVVVAEERASASDGEAAGVERRTRSNSSE
jgi:hypothetical protein